MSAHGSFYGPFLKWLRSHQFAVGQNTTAWPSLENVVLPYAQEDENKDGDELGHTFLSWQS